jgi:hypothetical protein
MPDSMGKPFMLDIVGKVLQFSAKWKLLDQEDPLKKVHSGILNDPEDNDDALGGKNKRLLPYSTGHILAYDIAK